jgi:putative phosphoesterase
MRGKSKGKEIILAVLGDTHVPDRVGELHPRLHEMLAEIKPDQILHTGDISQRSVLDELSSIAPILAVRGNRDWHWQTELPMEIHLEINGVNLMLIHGHGGWGHYIADNTDHTLRGYRLERYIRYLPSRYPNADGYIFGHSHFPENTRLDGKLFFNPGSACLGGRGDIPPSFGILTISGTGRIAGRIVDLAGYRIIAKSWVDATPETSPGK